MFTGVVSALLVLAVPATSGGDPPVCVDVSDQCMTTDFRTCTGLTTLVQVQIGGPGAEDSNGVNGVYTGTCEGTNAVALVTFTRLPANQLMVEIDNRTCDDNASLTALFFGKLNLFF